MSNFGGFSRTAVLTRVTTATTTVIGTVPSAGTSNCLPQSVSVYVKTSGGAASPTINGTAVPYTGFTLNLNALDAETLNPITVVTNTGDEVLITALY